MRTGIIDSDTWHKLHPALHQKIDRPINALCASLDSVLTNLFESGYATARFWKPKVALLVNEQTFLPVRMLFAPASNLAERFPAHPATLLAALDVEPDFVAIQVAAMEKGSAVR